MDGRRGRQVDACMAEFVQGVGTAAHGQELQIACHGLVTAVPDSLGQGDSGGIACRVFVDIEGPVEMRDPGPLIADFFVQGQRRSEIIADQPLVEAVQALGIQGLAALRHLMRFLLKLGKHDLAVDGPLEVFQILVEQGQTLPRILLCLQEMFNKQVLIDRGRDFRDKEGIFGILGRLGLVGMPGVHGVPHLVGNGGDTVQGACKVGQDKGI